MKFSFKYFLLIGLLSSGILFFLLGIFSSNYLLHLLITSMPIRGMFLPMVDTIGASREPNIAGLLLFYFLPFLFGIFVGSIFYKKIRKSKNIGASILFFSLLSSLSFILPMFLIFLEESLIYLDVFLSIQFFLILTPVLTTTGILSTFLFGSDINSKIFTLKKVKIEKFYIISIIILILFFVFVRYTMISQSYYPIGFDAYYHTALSMNILDGKSPFQSPLFYEQINGYPPLPHIIVAEISKITNISVLQLWPRVDLIVQVIFILSLFYLSLYLTKNPKISLISILFVLPWDQFWLEISSRRFALAILPLFIVFLLKGSSANKKYYIIAGLLSVLMLLSHLLIYIISFLILLVFFLIKKYHATLNHILNQIMVRFRRFWENARLNLPTGILNINYSKEGLILLLGYTIPLSYLQLYGIKSFQIFNVTKFSEIALSTYRPIGIITFIVFLFGIIGLPNLFKQNSLKAYALISIIFMYTLVFFYLTRIGILYPNLGLPYSRVFPEIAYIGIAILAAITFINFFDNIKSKKIKIAICFIVLLLFFMSIYPKILFNNWYAQRINDRMSFYNDILLDIRNLPKDSVILADPEDVINRYIPGVSGRYIFAGRFFKTVNTTWIVISPTIAELPWTKQDATIRYILAKQYFDNPTDDNLKEIQKFYRVTHLVVKEKFYKTHNLNQSKILNVISKASGYILLKIQQLPE